jgi:sugar lactone lactonase YvrE
VDVLPLRRGYVVADAGGNALHKVSRSGKLSALTIFPNRTVPNPMGGGTVPMQAVPTSVVRGPKGNYYVGQLTGFPFPQGGARVYRVNPRTGKAHIFAKGFTNVMDLAFGPRGRLYVLEIDANGLLAPGDEGAIFAVDRKGRSRKLSLPAGSLPSPGGIAVRRGALYVTINAGSPGDGRVVRIK